MFRTSVTWFIFNLQRGKILIAQQHVYNIHNELFAHVWRKKGPYWGLGVVALCARIQTSLHTNCRLWIDCPLSHEPFWPPPLPKQLSQPHSQSYDLFKWQKTTLTHWCLLMSRTDRTEGPNLILKREVRKNQQAYTTGQMSLMPIRHKNLARLTDRTGIND